MELSFKNEKLKSLCESEKKLLKKFGKKVANGIMRKITFLAAAASLKDVPSSPPYNRHILEGDKKGCFAIDAVNRSSGHRIVFSPSHDPIPTKEDGSLDFGKITAIEILEIEDYH